MPDIKTEIRKIANEYSTALKQKIDDRIKDMKEDDTSHYLIYKVPHKNLCIEGIEKHVLNRVFSGC